MSDDDGGFGGKATSTCVSISLRCGGAPFITSSWGGRRSRPLEMH